MTFELIYDVVDERTKELKDEMKAMRGEYQLEFKATRQEMKEMRTEYRDEFKAVNARIDQIHMRLDQIIHMISELKR